MLRVFTALILFFFLNGCFIAPGMRMKTPSMVATKSSMEALNEIKPIFIPIDVALVRNMNRIARVKQQDTYYYHVGPHDILNIYVWGHPELNGPIGNAAIESGANSQLSPSLSTSGYLVDPDGKIYFPLAGTIKVGGKTTSTIRTELAASLRKYIRNPQIDVRVMGFRSKKIYVMGEVVHPGIQPLTDASMSITDAINLAGGLDLKTSDPSQIFIIRGNFLRPRVYWLNAQSPDALLLGESFHLQSHDVVFVSTAGIARWNRAIEQILPTVQTAWFTYNITTQH